MASARKLRNYGRHRPQCDLLLCSSSLLYLQHSLSRYWVVCREQLHQQSDHFLGDNTCLLQLLHQITLLVWILQSRQPRKSATSLACYLIPVCAISPSVSASVALIVSTLIGVLSESFVSNIGILVTLLTAAALSNLRLVPLLHPFYDLCWNIFLPGSLAFLLLSSSSNENDGDRNASINNVQVAETVKRVAVPFVIGSIGSILGCIASFLICQRWQTLWLPPTSAGVAASCLCASYVGGSVNFFATANLLSSTQSDLMASMATADLMVMAIYFVFLTAAIQSKRLQRLFDGTENSTDSNGKRINEDLNMNVNSEFRKDASEEHRNQASRGDAVMATMMVSSLAFLLVQIANRVERYVCECSASTWYCVCDDCSLDYTIQKVCTKYKWRVETNATSGRTTE